MRATSLAKVFLLLALSVVFLSLGTGNAEAKRKLIVQNNSHSDVHVAVIFINEHTNTWYIQGWNRVPAYESRTFTVETTGSTLYYHAKNASGNKLTWGGGEAGIERTVSNQKMFEELSDIRSGSTWKAKFGKLKSRSDSTFKVNLNPPKAKG